MGTDFQPGDPQFEARVRDSFARQRAMQTLCAVLESVMPGRVEIRLSFREDLTQQHGFLHAGILSTVLDSACGYAALTLFPPGKEVLTVEFKVNLLRPASGDAFVACGQVVSAGRRLVVAQGTLRRREPDAKPLAVMQATLIAAE